MKLTKEELEVAKIQKEIKLLGWQWREEIYNDNIEGDCSIELINDTDPCAIDDMPEETIWGRFPRIFCWRKALITIKNGEKPKVK